MNTEKEMQIQFHIGKPELIHARPVETRTFNEVSAANLNTVVDIEKEDEKGRMRNEGEIHPDKQRNPSCL